MGRLPEWLKRPVGSYSRQHRVKSLLRREGLNTVCESARCPNIGECFSKPTATFMILGAYCTRGCTFCNVEKGMKPLPVDIGEPERVALAVKEMGLRHVVITSVTRDDLEDGGASQFALTIAAVRDAVPAVSVEVLTPDFKGDRSAQEVVLDARPDVFNHNIETVPSLYGIVRPGADYDTSLRVLNAAHERGVFTKSGMMLGLGEKMEEVRSVMEDMVAAGCGAITIGQYLRPNKGSLEVKEYVRPEVFTEYELMGRDVGFKYVYSGPFVRSSYNAEEQFNYS